MEGMEPKIITAYRTPVKAAVCVLLVLAVVLGTVCAGATLLFEVCGVYEDNNGDFWDTGYAKRLAERHIWEIFDWTDFQIRLNQGETLNYGENEYLEQLTDALTRTNVRAQVIFTDGSMLDTQAGKPTGELRKLFYEDTGSGYYYGWYGSTEVPPQWGIQGVQFYVDPSVPAADDLCEAMVFYEQASPWRWRVLGALAVCALLALAGWVYLLCAAGHRRGLATVTLNGFDRIPFDLLTVVFVLAGGLLLALAVESANGVWDNAMEVAALRAAAICVPAAGALALTMLWTVTLSARVKAHTLLRNTLIWRLCAWVGGLFCRAGKTVHGAVARENSGAEQKRNRWRTLWPVRALCAAGRWVRGIGRQLLALARGIGVVWKLCGLTVLALAVFGLLAMAATRSAFAGLLMLAAAIVIFLAVGFFALQLDRLKTGGEKLAAGDLGYKTDTGHLYWDLKKHAENLNAISDGMAVAVEERLKSERMKYELLTNVSHDIKTPLTSIVNYVELLKGEEIEGEQARAYIAVLDRQAARLKKLIADLIEASKASTGNITVHAARTDVAELLRQCAGEYSERFAACGLTPVLDLPEDEPQILADGRLLWRVFDNLLGNIVKYAMPGTRVYLDLEDCGSRVAVSLKNISRERLNIAADELMERFVRGDASRATEGSGLGLSIARSLTELMGGRLELLVDGDLFKASLFFEKLV